MMLIELTTVPLAALPVQIFKDHLRLGTGFADDGVQDGLAESCLRAAMAAIEARIGKALLSRNFQLVLQGWRDPAVGINVRKIKLAAGLQQTVRGAEHRRLVGNDLHERVQGLGSVDGDV